jgi:hypothetical protein
LVALLDFSNVFLGDFQLSCAEYQVINLCIKIHLIKIRFKNIPYEV